MSGWMERTELELHISRGWGPYGGALEAACPCPKAVCGMVIAATADQNCPEHAIMAGKTLRGLHDVSECPGRPTDAAAKG